MAGHHSTLQPHRNNSNGQQPRHQQQYGQQLPPQQQYGQPAAPQQGALSSSVQVLLCELIVISKEKFIISFLVYLSIEFVCSLP
jgi:hypothetical protein